MARKVRPVTGQALCEDCIEKKCELYQSEDYQAVRDWNRDKKCNLGGCKHGNTVWDTYDLYKKDDDPFDSVN